MNAHLIHYGILGMRWGHRKNILSPSSDHSRASEIKKKGIRNMSDDELDIVTKRMALVKKFKDSQGLRKKPIHSMTNDELELGAKQGKLAQLDWRFGVRKNKRIIDMNKKEVDDALKRFEKEHQYRKLRTEELVPIRAFVSKLIRFYMMSSG